MAKRQEGNNQVTPQPSGYPPLTPPRTGETMVGGGQLILIKREQSNKRELPRAVHAQTRQVNNL